MSKFKNATAAALIIAIAAIALTGCLTTDKASNDSKPVILIAAFGSSYESGQKNLEDFDKAVRAAFPENEVTWGFTASFIVKKLKKQGVDTLFESQVPVRGIADAVADLAAEGKTNVVVVNFLLMVGQEYREVLDVPTSGLNVKYVHPVLYYPENIQNVVTALEGEFGGADEATVLCAHGNEAHPEYNAELIQIDQFLRENYKNTYLAVMEGTPEFEPVKEAIAESGVKSVKYVTFMLTYGDHMSNDVMGDEEDAMKVRIGLPAECSDGLASVPSVQGLFIEKIKLALSQF
ncbi:MAG TPA: hypothetical protein DCO79_15425 [Spirochaeta sp.]|nr:hypothetical protein [Spirochaeta sp.]